MIISLIAAIGKNRELGFGNKLPWYLPDDFKRFRELTVGHVIVMGRKTFESLGRPLPHRTNIIISRHKNFAEPDCITVPSFEAALRIPRDDEEVFVIGGGEIFKLALPLADKMYLTLVEANPPADVFFPAYDESEWRVIHSEEHQTDKNHPFAFTFFEFGRR